MYGKDIILENHSIEVLAPLEGLVLKNQILEEMKIDGFIEIGKTLVDKLDFIKDALDLKKVPTLKGESSGQMGTVIKETVADNITNIKNLEERRKNGEEGLDDIINTLYKENKELLILVEDIQDGNFESMNQDEEKDTGSWLDHLNTLKNAFGNETENLEDANNNPLEYFNESKELSKSIEDILEGSLIDFRNQVLLDEYILKFFSTMVGEGSGEGSGEVEWIMSGEGGKGKVMVELFLLRFLLDGVGAI